MRSILELLLLLRKELKRVFREYREVYFLGLCYLTVILFRKDKINSEEYDIIKSYIQNNLLNKNKKYLEGETFFIWEPGKIFPRYIWLTKQIIKERIKLWKKKINHSN